MREVVALSDGGLAGLYFERPSLPKFLELHLARVARAGLPPARLDALASRDLFPLFGILRVRGFDPPEPICRAQVIAAIASAGKQA